MFAIHFRRHMDDPADHVVVARDILTLDEAKARREASGDLVVHAHSHEVVNSQDWLWDWEKSDPNCYARRAIATRSTPAQAEMAEAIREYNEAVARADADLAKAQAENRAHRATARKRYEALVQALA